MTTLCIVEPGLKNFIGHHFQYVRSIYDCAIKRADPILILGHRHPDPEIAKYLPIERVFRRSPNDFPTTLPGIRDLVNPSVQNYSFFQDLRTSLKERCRPDWTVFTTTMTHNQLYAWAAWLQRTPVNQCPTVILFVRNSYCLQPDPSHYDKRAYFCMPGYKWLDRLAASGRRIHLVTDSERLASEYSRLTRLPMPIFPTPHTDMIPPPTDTETARTVPRLAWLGGIRKDKGFLVFADAILQLEEELRAGRLEFVIQSHVFDPNDSEVGAALNSIKNARLPGITYIERPLSGEEYISLLSSAGAIVLPRLVQMFRSQTSGPFVEALAAGKPVVVTAESWMSDQLKNHGAGVTFKDQDAVDLAKAIRTLVANYGEFSARARRSAAEWVSIHNPDRLYDMIRNVEKL